MDISVVLYLQFSVSRMCARVQFFPSYFNSAAGNHPNTLISLLKNTEPLSPEKYSPGVRQWRRRSGEFAEVPTSVTVREFVCTYSGEFCMKCFIIYAIQEALQYLSRFSVSFNSVTYIYI